MKDANIEKEWYLELIDLLDNHFQKATHDGEKALMLEMILIVKQSVKIKD